MDGVEGDIINLVDRIESAGVNALLEIAGQNSANYDKMAKAAVHYTLLGNPGYFQLARELILGLEELEESNPELRPKVNIVNKLAPTLAGTQGRHGLQGKERMMCECRVHASMDLLLEISRKRPLKVARPLLAASSNPKQTKNAGEILDRIIENRLGKTDIETLKGLVRITTATLDFEETAGVGQDGRIESVDRHVLPFVNKIIDECENPLIYFAGPLLGAMRRGEETAGALLDKILGKPFGNMDEEMLIELGKVLSANINLSRTDSGRQYGYAIKIAKKAIRECENAPIYLLRNLILALNDPGQAASAELLLDDIRVHIENGGRLGNADEVTLK